MDETRVSDVDDLFGTRFSYSIENLSLMGSLKSCILYVHHLYCLVYVCRQDISWIGISILFFFSTFPDFLYPDQKPSTLALFSLFVQAGYWLDMN